MDGFMSRNIRVGSRIEGGCVLWIEYAGAGGDGIYRGGI